jgi:hypothetical protein
LEADVVNVNEMAKQAADELALLPPGWNWRDKAAAIIARHFAGMEAEAGAMREALQQFLQAAFMPSFGDYSGYESATYTYEKSYGGGECSKHGRYYGSCSSCRLDFERFQRQKDAEARRSRDNALDTAMTQARAALQRTAPERPAEKMVVLEGMQPR